MTIIPQSNVKLLTGIPFNKFDNETIYFSSVSAQTSYFLSHVKTSVTNCTYIRNDIETNQYVSDIGRVALGVRPDSIYDCNYIMFQNTGFSNKWFYGFIDKIEYKNNETAIVQFTIDETQTWLTSAVVNPCYVLREHVSDDTIGHNLEAEPVSVSRYTINATNDFILAQKYDGTAKTYPWYIGIAYVPNDETSGGTMINGVFSGCSLYTHKLETSEDISAVDTFINGLLLSNPKGTIVCIYMYPSRISNDSAYNLVLQDNEVGTKGSSLAGYVPKNNKLYTSPYNGLVVTNNSGSSKCYSYERLAKENGYVVFNLTTNFTMGFKGILYPYAYSMYNNGSYETFKLYDEGIPVPPAPLCSWNTDAYAYYQAENSGADKFALVGGILKSLAGGMVSNFNAMNGGIGTSIPGVSTMLGSAEAYNEYQAKQIKAEDTFDTVSGTVDTANLLVNADMYGFIFYRISASNVDAEKIDSYFTRYGYAVNQYKTPNLTGRENFNYVKTKNCRITGNIPQESARRLESMFNNGITLWHTNVDSFDYTISNNIINEED